MKSLQLLKIAGESILNKKGTDVKKIDLKKVTSIADYFLICSADVEVQVRAIADEIESDLKSKGEKVWKREGDDFSNWIILDYVDVVIHVMKKETRDFYKIENLWSDAKISEIAEKKKKTAKPKTKPATKQK